MVDTRSGRVDSRLAGFSWPYRILIVEKHGLVVIPDLRLDVVRFVRLGDRTEL
ncbi:MAG: hypothetical protein GWN48_13680, partial [Actinobacteria bacterium]|nr:hypothetical protein [Actinomycetota bacterium]